MGVDRSEAMRQFLKLLGYLAGALLFAIPLWIRSEYGEVTVDQVLYHLGFGSSALFASDPELTWRFVWRALAPAMGSGILLLLCDALVTKVARVGPRQALADWGRQMRSFAARLARPAERMLGTCHYLIRYRFYLLVPAVGTVYFVHAMGIVDYVGSYYGPDHFSAAYVDPKKVRIGGDRPRSLVMIYVESLENTYSDPQRFGRDLLARLNKLKSHGISFENYQEKRGAHFTIAGIVSTQCGIPLRSLGMFGGNDQGEQANRFLPRARCLGDILHDRGYTNVFLNGSSLAFAGVGKFFEDHHYDKIMGREEWLALGARAEDMSGWGLHDDHLFARAREELDQLASQRRPFNLSILTIDGDDSVGSASVDQRDRAAAGDTWTAQASLLGRAARRDASNPQTLLRDGDVRDADVAANDAAMRNQFRNHAPNQVRGNGESNPRALRHAAGNRRVHPDQSAMGINQRAAGVAGIDGGIDLNDRLNRTVSMNLQ